MQTLWNIQKKTRTVIFGEAMRLERMLWEQCYAFALGLVSFSAFLFFFSCFLANQRSWQFWKTVAQYQSWQFSFLLLLCASFLLRTKRLRWSPESRGGHDIYLSLTAVFSQFHKWSNSGNCQATRVCTVSQNNRYDYIVFKKISACPVGVWCQNHPFGLDQKGTAPCL